MLSGKDSMENRRRYKRFSVDIMQIRGKIASATEVTILEISLSEISLKADTRLNIGSEYALKLTEQDNALLLKGTVIWSSLTETKKDSRGDLIPFYTAGMKFTDLSEDTVPNLIRFIRSYQEDKELRMSDVTLHADASEKAFVDILESCHVKKMGLGGMLIETGRGIEIERRLPMQISLPGGAPLRFLGRVASCLSMPDMEPERYDIGIEFVDMADKDRDTLKAFIRVLENPAERSGEHPDDIWSEKKDL